MLFFIGGISLIFILRLVYLHKPTIDIILRDKISIYLIYNRKCWDNSNERIHIKIL